MPFIPEYQIPLHLHSGLKRLLRYVYKHQGKSLAPNANAVIAYFSDDKLGECWVNIHEGSGPWTMVYSVSSKEFEPRLKLKYPKDKYVTFGTDEFNELLAAAADFADSQRCPQEEEEECTQESFAQLADDPSPNDSTSDSENQGRNGTGSQDNAHRPDNVPKSDSTEQYDSVRVNDSEAVNSQNLPQPPLTPEQPVRVKAAIQSPTPSRLATQLHDRPQLDFKPDLKRLRQTRDANANQVMPSRVKLEPCSQGIKTEPVEQGPAQEQHAWTLDVKLEPTEASSSSTCACGLPGVPCKAHGCSALYCQPCDRKCKEADTFAGFQSCSSGCCRKVRYCEQHRNMLKRCHVCEELCCMRASCQRCTNIVCVSCKASHTRAGCAA